MPDVELAILNPFPVNHETLATALPLQDYYVVLVPVRVRYQDFMSQAVQLIVEDSSILLVCRVVDKYALLVVSGDPNQALRFSILYDRHTIL
jgi:hypothetical protein